MNLVTPVIMSAPSCQITPDTPVMLLGSCFADEMGGRLEAAGFDVLGNPFGTLYNPLSVATCLHRIIDNHPMEESDLVCYDSVWHSWLHHSRFSHSDKTVCLERCNNSIRQSHDFMEKRPLLVITFGTAWVYTLAEGSEYAADVSHRVVANCHKIPQCHFNRHRLSVQDIVDVWHPLLELLNERVPGTVLTVSPIRHMADGAHGNQLSKATLLLAVDSLVKAVPQTGYFDSYELLMDELRDYRFYARDMCHPSDVAVDMVWERFQQTYLSESGRDIVRQREKAFRHTQHRPIITNPLIC